MPKAYSDCTKQVVIYVPPPPGPRTGRYIAKIAVGGNQGNRASQGRSQGSPGVEDRRNGTDRATERSGPWNGTDHFTSFLGKRCRRATQTERTVFRTFFRRVPYVHFCISAKCMLTLTSI